MLTQRFLLQNFINKRVFTKEVELIFFVEKSLYLKSEKSCQTSSEFLL